MMCYKVITFENTASTRVFHKISSSVLTYLLILLTTCGVTFCKQECAYLSPFKFATLKPEEIINFYGYPGEAHKVLTEDGYILTNHRIANPGGYPILLMHGGFATSDCWLTRGPPHDIAFRLWDLGYDVWLWNSRGNHYSTEHVNMSSKDDRFYRYSMHDIGMYDTTASIDYMLKLSGHESVITIGHSMGCQNVLIATTMRPEYQAKVRLNMLWAQAVLTSHMAQRGSLDAGYSTYVRWLNYDHKQGILQEGSNLLAFSKMSCSPDSIFREFCYLGMGIVSGLGSEQTVKTSVMKMMTKFPSSNSLNTLKQWVQNMRAGEIAPLSYSPSENLRRYGRDKPLPYPIHEVTIPTAIYYGCCNDVLSSALDAHILKSKLRNVVKFYEVPYKKWNHGDFLWAKDGYELLYHDVLELIRRYTPEQSQSNRYDVIGPYQSYSQYSPHMNGYFRNNQSRSHWG